MTTLRLALLALFIAAAQPVAAARADAPALGAGVPARLVLTLPTEKNIARVALSRDGKILGMVGYDNSLEFWNIDERRLIAAHADSGRGLIFLDAPCRAVTAKWFLDGRRSSIMLYPCDALDHPRAGSPVRGGIDGFAVAPACGLGLARIQNGRRHKLMTFDVRRARMGKTIAFRFPYGVVLASNGGDARQCRAHVLVDAPGSATGVAIYAVDLRRASVERLGTIDASYVTPSSEDWATTSPSGNLMAAPVAIKDQMARSVAIFDLTRSRNLPRINPGMDQLSGIAFIDEHHLLYTPTLRGANIADLTSDDTKAIDFAPSKAFRAAGAIATAPRARRIAVAGHLEVRVYELAAAP